MLKREDTSTRLKATILSNAASEESRIELIKSCLLACPVVQCDTDLFSFEDRILHQKCPVIRLVKWQMNNIENALNDDFEDCKG